MNGYREIDVAILGGNAALAALAAREALRAGFSTLLAAGMSLDDVPAEALDDPDMGLLVGRKLRGEGPVVDVLGARLKETLVGHVVEAVSLADPSALLLRLSPCTAASVSHVARDGRVVLLLSRSPSAVADPSASRITSPLRSTRPEVSASAEGHTCVFAKRVVVCGMADGVAPATFEATSKDGAKVDWHHREIMGFGSASTVPRTAGAALTVFVDALPRLLAGAHLRGLAR